METRANYALIGLFTLFVVAGGFLFVYWFAVSEKGQDRLQVQILFRDSVAGLSRGSSVSFNGLRVGEVAELRLDPQDPSTVIARIVIDANTPVRADTRARLEYQGLTGIAVVSLTGGSSAAPALAAEPGAPTPTIVAEPSDFQDLMRTGQEIARSASETLERVNRLVDENIETITATVSNVEKFSRALSDNAPAIDSFLEQVGNAAERIAPLADTLDELSRSTNAIVSAVDPETVAATVRNVESFTQTLADTRGQIDQIFANATAMTGRLNAASLQIEATLDDVSAAIRAVDAERINATISNVEAFSQTLAENRENVSQVIANAATLTENLSATATKIDVAIEQISGLAAAVDREQLAATLANVEGFSRVLAESGGEVEEVLRRAGEISRAVDPEQIAAVIDSAERFANALGARADDVDRIVANAATLTESLNATATRIDGAVEQISGLAAAVDREQIAATLANVEGFSRILAESGGEVEEVLRRAGEISRAVDPEQIAAVIDSAERFASALGARADDVDRIVANAATLTENLNATAARIDGAVEQISGLAAAVDREQLAATLANVEGFSRVLAEHGGDVGEVLRRAGEISRAIDPEQIAAAIDSAERFANALGGRAGDVDRIVASAAELVEKLNASADRVDGVLVAAESFLGTAEDQAGEGLFEDIREAAQAIRTLADNLDSRTAEITAGISRFTGPGLQEYRALADDGRRALEDISRAFRALERNPQQLIFGGQSSVPEFRGRR